MAEQPRITYEAAFDLTTKPEPAIQDAGTLLPTTRLTFHLPLGAIEVRHKGTHLEIRRAWDRHNTYLALIPGSAGEILATVVPFPPEDTP